MLATDITFQDVMLIAFGTFMTIAFLGLLAAILYDVFRSRDLGGWGKALWVLVVIGIPFLGSLGYLVVRGPSMSDRYFELAGQRVEVQAQERREDAVERVAKLAEMRDAGTITDDEFERLKRSVVESV